MAKKKRGPGRPKAAAPREPMLTLKGVPEAKTWLSEFAAYCGLSQTDTLWQALIYYAEERGFRAPPRR
jgi:hypothetical protein